jgi:hypothetical protein
MARLDQVIGYGTHGARPAPTSAGRIYFESDTGRGFRSNGTVWQQLWYFPDAQTYDALVREDNPVGYWRLGETANPVLDGSGNGNVGTISGGVTAGVVGLLAGDADTCMAFDGIDGEVRMAAIGTMPLTDSFSVEAWFAIDPAQTETGNRTLFAYGDSSDVGTYNILAVAPTTVRATWWGGDDLEVSGLDIELGTIHHLVESYNSTTGIRTLYLDGEQIGFDAPSSPPAFVATGLPTIGRLPDYGDPFMGSIDEVAVYSTPLAAARVLAHYSRGMGA